MNETHFILNMDNGKTLGFRGDDDVKYMGVVSEGIPMTMVVHITEEPWATIEVPFMIIQNYECNYPIRGLPDNMPGVCYHTSKNASMTRDVWD